MKYLLVLCLWLGATGSVAGEMPPGGAPVVSIATWVGQRLEYDIDFLWFDSIAEGHLSVTAGPRPGTYLATLEARTLGVAAWLTSDRVQRYVSLMEISPSGPLRALSYESRIIKGPPGKRRDRGKRYLFEHGKKQVCYQRARDGVYGAEKILPMKGALPDDILTAFFNFQAGVYGLIAPGGRYRIPTLAKQGIGYIEAEVLTKPAWVKPEFFPRDGTLVKITVDPEVFDTKEGTLYVWFDRERRPTRGIVENVIGLGDVYGVQKP